MQAGLSGHSICSMMTAVNVDSNLIQVDLLRNDTARQQKHPKHTSILAPKR